MTIGDRPFSEITISLKTFRTTLAVLLSEIFLILCFFDGIDI